MLLAQAQIKIGDERGADASLDEAVSLGKQRGEELGPDGKYAAAHARYMQGERVLAKFEQIQIQGDVKQLKARLKQKAELLKEAAKVFLDCVSMGVAEWTTAALYQIGHMYEAFAKSLRDAPPPPEVKTEDQKADYQSQIEEFAVPMEERSLDAYENGWKKAIELGIYNQWTAKMRDALGRLNSELYPPFKETGFEVRSQGPLPLPAAHRGAATAPCAAVAAPAPAHEVPLATADRKAEGVEAVAARLASSGLLSRSSLAACGGARPRRRRRRGDAVALPPANPHGRRRRWCRGCRPRRTGSARARDRAAPRGDRARREPVGGALRPRRRPRAAPATSRAPRSSSRTAAKLAPDAQEVAVALGRGAAPARRAARPRPTGSRDFVQDHPNAVDARTLYVAALRESGQIDKAIAEAREVLVRKPADASALAELALSHLAKGEKEAAALLAKQALDASPNSAVAQRATGLIALANGDDAEAFAEFRKATQADPHDTTSRLNMGVVLLRAGAYAEGRGAVPRDPPGLAGRRRGAGGPRRGAARRGRRAAPAEARGGARAAREGPRAQTRTTTSAALQPRASSTPTS